MITFNNKLKMLFKVYKDEKLITYDKIQVAWDSYYNKFITLKPITYKFENIYNEVKSETIFIVREGLRTDFGSIPVLFRWVFNPIGKEVPAYLLHDYLCDQARLGILDREDADFYLLKVLESVGTSIYRRYMIYYFCRLHSIYLNLKKKGFK